MSCCVADQQKAQSAETASWSSINKEKMEYCEEGTDIKVAAGEIAKALVAGLAAYLGDASGLLKKVSP